MLNSYKNILVFTKKINQEYLDSGIIDFQEITDFALELSGGKFAAFNLFVEGTNDFKTIKISGDNKKFTKALDIIGFNPVGKVWNFDPIREERIKNNTVTLFNSLEDLAGNLISENKLSAIEKIAGIKETVIIRIAVNNKTAADFTIFIDKDKNFQRFEEAKLFASQIGILIEKLNVSRNLIENKEKMDFIVEVTGAGAWDLDMETKKIKFSPEWKNMLGYSDEEIENSFEGWRQLWHPQDVEIIKKALDDHLKGKTRDFEVLYRLKHKDGYWKWVLARGVLFRDEKDNPIRWMGINVDVTTIREEKERLDNIILSSNAGIWEWNVESGAIKFNERWFEILGYSKEDLDFDSVEVIKKIAHPEDFEKSIKKLNKILNKEEPYYSSEIRLRHKNGNWVWIMDTGKVISWTSDDKPLLMFGTHIDISNRKELEKKIIESKEEYETLVENSYDIIYRINTEGFFEFISKAWNTTLGYSVEETVGKSFKPYVHPEDLEKVNNFFEKIKETSERTEITDYRLKDSTGNWHVFNTNAVPIFDDFGKVSGYVGTARDITKLKIALEEVVEQKEELERFFSVNLDLLCITDFNGNFKRINKSWERVLGYSSEQILKTNFLSYIHPEDLEKTKDSLSTLKEGEEVINFTNRYRSFDGNYKYIEWRSAPYKDLIYAAARDVTENIEKQKEVEYLSFHDNLTGLYNRRYMEDSLKRLDTERNLPLTIMIMDVNGLKMTNDAFGHKMGDDLLKISAQIIQDATRSDDILCRTGGDEFMLILPQTDEEAALRIKERIKEKTKKTTLGSIVVSLAIGYETKTDGGQDIGDIQRQADSKMYKDKFKNSKEMRIQTIKNIIRDIDKKTSFEKGHRERVTKFALKIGKTLSFDENHLKELQLAASVHDIGKIMVSKETLNKKEKLTKEEWEELKRHSVIGYNILKSIDDYAGIAEDILYHHEKYNGKGYPKGLKGEDIPLISRILAVADAYEAMTSQRPYKEAKTIDNSIMELKRCSGKDFDPQIVEIFIKQIEERGINENEV